MHPLLAKLENELTAAISTLDARQTQLRPPGPSNCWSIHQIVQHLVLTYDLTSTSIEDRLAKGTPTRSRPTAKHRVIKFVVLTLGQMPGRRAAPIEVVPPALESPLSGEPFAQSVSASLANLDRNIDAAANAFGAVPFLTHFALGPLSASQWRRLHLTHGRHHIRQIRSILRANGL